MRTMGIDALLQTQVFNADDVQVMAVRGRERVGQLFRFDIDLLVIGDVASSALDTVGALAALLLRDDSDGREDGGAIHRRIDGVIAQARERLDRETGRPLWRLTLVPRAHLLTLVHTQEVYVDTSIVDVIKGKLDLAQLDYEMRLNRTYPPRELVVQYDETDLAFVQRLCEHDGISFFFAPGDDQDRLVFTDDNGFAPPFRSEEASSAIPFRARGDKRDVYALEREGHMISKFYLVGDYNPRTPLVDLTRGAASEIGAGGGRIEYGTHHLDPDEGEIMVNLRREEHECRQVVYRGASDRPDLGAGVIFKLTEHPRWDDLSLLVVEVEHDLRQTAAGDADGEKKGYAQRFVAVETSTVYRPERLTPRPRIRGLTSAIVMPSPGSDGVKPWIDHEGRYVVRFLFDTANHEGNKASHPVRMLQAHAGAGFGTHFPLRPGVEVLLAFVDGDPDRPLIVGAAPNAVTPSPVVDEEALHHRIKTASGVKIEFEDAF